MEEENEQGKESDEEEERKRHERATEGYRSRGRRAGSGLPSLRPFYLTHRLLVLSSISNSTLTGTATLSEARRETHGSSDELSTTRKP